MISIRMLKICGKCICRPLELIFNEFISNGLFPSQEKQQTIFRILERLLFNEMFPFFIKNGLILQNQSGFKLGETCVNQLLSITHEIYKSFDDGFDVRSVFLNILKALDKV